MPALVGAALALGIFVVVYAAISVPALPRLVRSALGTPPSARIKVATDLLFDRPGIAVLGALAMVVVGVVGPRAALAAVDGGVLALLLGMMLLVAGLEAAGFFEVLATRLVHRFPTPQALLVAIMATTAVLSALILNDAVVLLFTPVIVKACRSMRYNPLPFLIVEAVSANIGSVATPVGNPQNAYIALETGLTFAQFARSLLPIALASLVIAVAWALWWFRRDLRQGPEAAPPPRAEITNRPMFALGVTGVGLTLAGFLVAERVGVELWQVALAGGLLVALLSFPVARVGPHRLFATVDWTIIAFFVGLFVLIEGVRGTGLVAFVEDATGASSLGGLMVAVAVLSQLVSNVPAVFLLLPAVGSTEGALALAAASTLAGNATILGAAANVIVAQSARTFGAELNAWAFLKYGLPVTVGTMVVAAAWLITF